MIKNCLARIGCLTVLLLVLGGAWWFRDDIAGWWGRLQITSSSRPSEAMAETAAGKLETLLDPGNAEPVSLSQTEIQSLLTYRAGPLLPSGVYDPLVELRDSTILFSARIDPEALEGVASPEVVQRLFSDSSQVLVELLPGVVSPGVARAQVVTLQAGAIVIPPMMVPWILENVDIPGVETTGAVLLLPTPGRVARFAVEEGNLLVQMRADVSP